MKDLKNKTKQKNNSWSQECLTICYNFYKPLNIKKKKVISYHKSTGTCNNVCMITYGLGQVRLVEKKSVYIYI